MIQVIFFLAAISIGIYGALTGSILALIAAAVGMLVGAGGLLAPAPDRQQKEQQRIGQWLQQNGWILFLLLALVAEGLTIRQMAADEFSKSSGIYWIIGIILVIIAGVMHDYAPQASQSDPEPETDLLVGAEPAGATDHHSAPASHAQQDEAAAGSTVRTVYPRAWRAWRRQWLEWLIVLGITAMALWLRLYRLNDFLPSMHGDEGEMGELARLALRGPASGIRPQPLPLFGIGFLDHPTLFHYLQAPALVLFGDSLSGLRTLSAIFGALCVPPLYLIARRGWGQIAAVTAAWLLAVSHLHIHYSRIALNNIQSVWTIVVLVMLFVLAFSQQRQQQNQQQQQQQRPAVLLLILAGLTIGLSQYFYYGSRLLPVVAGIYLLFLLFKRQFSFAQFLGLAMATLVPYSPMLYLYSRNWQSFLNRTQGVSVISPEGVAHILGGDATWPRDIPWLLWEQLKRNSSFFVDKGDSSSFYLQDLPAFDPLTVLLFWLGLGLVLTRGRRFQNFALLVWVGTGVVLGGILTNDSPYGPRLIMMVPAVYLIAAVPLQRLYNVLHQLWSAAAHVVVGGVLILAGLGTLQANYTTYFDTYTRFTPNMLAISMAHTIDRDSDEYRFYIYGEPHFYANYSVLRFITPESERYNASTVEEVVTAIQGEAADDLDGTKSKDTEKKGIVIIALLHRVQEFDTLATLFPGGIREEHTNAAGQLLYLSYRLSPTQVAALGEEKGEREPSAAHQNENDFIRETGPQPDQFLSPLPTRVE